MFLSEVDKGCVAFVCSALFPPSLRSRALLSSGETQFMWFYSCPGHWGGLMTQKCSHDPDLVNQNTPCLLPQLLVQGWSHDSGQTSQGALAEITACKSGASCHACASVEGSCTRMKTSRIDGWRERELELLDVAVPGAHWKPPSTSQVHKPLHSPFLLIWVHTGLLTLATKIFPHYTFPGFT